MKLVSTRLRNLLRNYPITIYLIPVPVFFCAGAGLEFVMIKWRPNGINFCEYPSAALLHWKYGINICATDNWRLCVQ